MSNSELIPMLEAVLFAMGEPIEIERLCVALELDEIVVSDALLKLQKKYEEENSQGGQPQEAWHNLFYRMDCHGLLQKKV